MARWPEGDEAPDDDVLVLGGQLATFLQQQGKKDLARSWYEEKVLPGCERMYGEEGENTLTTVMNLAALLDDMGEYQAAKGMYERALAGQERTLGAEHESTLATVGNLAILLMNMGLYTEAEPCFQRQLDTLKGQVRGPRRLPFPS